jgi:ribosomal protein S18 acetylase RimI-like enzyme
MPFQIREKTKEDMGWLIPYMKENWGSEKIVTRNIIHDACEASGFIAVSNDKPAGIILYEMNNRDCEIILLESFIEKIGIGTTLLKCVEEKAVANGCHRVWLITTNDNMKAVRFYQLRGFSLVAVHRNAIAESRKLKPEIPLQGIDGIPLRDEIELEFKGDSMMEFRKMTVNDVTEVAKLYNELAYFIKNETKDEYFNFDTLPETELEKQLKESIGKPALITFVVLDDGNVIAFISGEVRECFLPISKDKKVGYISGAYVLPNYRNQGIMKNLESLLLQYFKIQGLSYAELNVITNNFVGKNSWESLGYKTFREQMRKKI